MQFKDPVYATYREAVGRVIAQEFNGTYSGDLTSSAPREWLSAKQAAAKLGISGQRLVEAVQQGDIAGKTNQSGYGHRHTVIPAFEVLVIAEERIRFWTGQATRDFLGITRGQFNLLKDAGLILEISSTELPALVDGGYSSLAVKGRVELIRSAVWPVRGETISFKELTLRRTTDRTALMKAFKQIFDGTIQAVSADENEPLAEFRFLQSDIELVLRSERHSLDWTANDVAKLTGWKAQCVTHWCKEGLLEARTVPHGRSVGFQINPENLSKFQGEFIPVATLANSRSTSSRKLLLEVAKRGIPTLGSKEEGNTTRGHLVKLADLVSIQPVIERPVFETT